MAEGSINPIWREGVDRFRLEPYIDRCRLVRADSNGGPLLPRKADHAHTHCVDTHRDLDDGENALQVGLPAGLRAQDRHVGVVERVSILIRHPPPDHASARS